MGNIATPRSEEAISELLEVYGEFERVSCDQGETILVGHYALDATYDDIRLAEDFQLQLTVPADYPKGLPKVKEVSTIIDRTYEHLYFDGAFCLGIQGELLLAQLKSPSLVNFLEGPVCSYLYSYLFHERYGRYPFGDRAHGAAGILQYYEELFGETDPVRTIKLLEAVCQDGYRGHLPCPCGSGLIARKCHGKDILRLKKSGAATAFSFDLGMIAGALADAQESALMRNRTLSQARKSLVKQYRARTSR